MLPRVGNFLVRKRFNWRPFFQGRALLLTNTLSGAALFGLGDVLQQSRENAGRPDGVRNWRRTAFMCMLGCSMGPQLQFWYTWLDRLFVGRCLRSASMKVLVDQIVAAPIFGVWYYLGVGYMEGRTLSEGWKRFKNEFWEFYMAYSCVWPPAQMINFCFLSNLRVIYTLCVCLGWDICLCCFEQRASLSSEQRLDSEAEDVQQEAAPSSRSSAGESSETEESQAADDSALFVAMPPRVRKFVFHWRTLFQGRTLLLTNTLSPGLMMTMGDLLQQTRENFGKRDQVHDWKRTGRMFTVGCSMGPPLHCWFYLLDRLFVGRALKTLAMKIVVDQMVNSPFMGMWYFMGMGLMEGNTFSKAFQIFKSKFWELYTTDCCVWPPAQLINFYFVAPRFRVIYVNCIDLGWDVYLSYLKHRDDIQPVSGSSAVAVQQDALPPPKPLEKKVQHAAGVPAQL